MLNIILREFANFEKKHNVAANVLDISHTHFKMFVEQYPGIFDPNSEIDLGFYICLHDDRDQINPAVRKMAERHSQDSQRVA